ncbi:MAG: TIGR02996 domain-containing protein [Kofleriaceae bacterium]
MTPSITAALERAAAGTQPLAELLAAWAVVPAGELADAIAGVPLDPEFAHVVTSDASTGLARLTKLPESRDPRISALLVQWLAAPPWHATSSQSFYRSVLARLEAIGDPRAIAALGRASTATQKRVKGESMRNWLVDRIARTRDVIRARTPKIPVLGSADRALLGRAAEAAANDRASALPAKRSRRTHAADQLLAAIHADPSDNAARQVYADVLAEKGDPRGTFITMQLARSGRDPLDDEAKRELTLLAKHAKIWLGPLAGVAGSFARYALCVGPARSHGYTRFDRGFLVECTIQGTERKLAHVLEGSELATVERLRLRLRLSDAGDLLERAPLGALRALEYSGGLLEAVLASPIAAQLVEIGVASRDLTELHELVRALPRLPQVRRLELAVQARPADTAREAVRTALTTAQLETIHVRYGVSYATFSRSNTQWKLALDQSTGSKTLEADLRPLLSRGGGARG